jgi:PAS domain S-box-containing protein
MPLSEELYLRNIHSEDVAYVEDLVVRARRGREPVLNGEFRIVRSDGEVRQVVMRCCLVQDGMGQPVRWEGIIQDVTERKRIEDALRKSEERFRLIAENAHDLIYRMSLPDGRYEYVSPAVERITGYSPEECYQNPKLVQTAIHPDWQAYFVREWEKLLRGEGSDAYEYRIRHRSGEWRWLYQRNVLVRDAAGMPTAIEGIVSDITDRKEKEAALEARIEALEAELAQARRVKTPGVVAGRRRKS